MRTVVIICIECSIRVHYDDCSIRVSRDLLQIQVAERWSNTVSLWAPALLSTTAIDSIMCDTEMLSSNM